MSAQPANLFDAMLLIGDLEHIRDTQARRIRALRQEIADLRLNLQETTTLLNGNTKATLTLITKMQEAIARIPTTPIRTIETCDGDLRPLEI